MNAKKYAICICLIAIMLAQSLILPAIRADVQSNQTSVDQTLPSPDSSVSLPAGQVVYYNTWNSSLQNMNQQPQSPPEPLKPVKGSWIIEEQIPSMLFNGQPTDGCIDHQYVFYDNGSFLAYDDQNNTLGWTLSGLPNGTLSTSMEANSTEVIQHFTVASGLTTAANVSVTYSVLYSFGYAAGLKITIAGNAFWGLAKNGSIGLAFSQPPSILSPSSASFDSSPGTNASSIQLDWSDSLGAYLTSFDTRLNSVQWTVPSSFSIDPKVVANSSNGYATADDLQEKIFGANGCIWAYYATNDSWYRSSSLNLGLTWTSPVKVTSRDHLGSNQGVYYAVTNLGNTVYEIDSWANQYDLRIGTLSSDGSVQYTTNETKPINDTHPNTSLCPSIYVNSSGSIFYSLVVNSGDNASGNNATWHIEVFSIHSNILYINVSSSDYCGQLLGSSNIIALLFGCGGPISAVWSNDSGNTWSSPVNTTDSYNISQSQSVMVGDTIYMAAENSSGLYFLSFNTTSGNWSYPQLLDSSASYAGISTDGSSSLVIYYCNSTTVSTVYSANLGKSWNAPFVLSSSENNAKHITMGPNAFNGYAFAEWTSGSSNPYYIRFSSIPMVFQNAATSTNEWSKPGLSPYESYFTQESEYVSPGNGLLGIEQTDFSLQGRGGLDLAITRVYCTPYVFSGSPFEYDNYSAVNLGLGWQLSFPWFGQNYFHLWDGEVYPYSWNGSVFENHFGTDFRLVNNSGSSYDLYSVSGVDYHFDSSKSLVSITDPSGNNTISLAYSAGQISTITDTVGRNVTFIYNANGMLSTLVTGEGNWTYAYSGSNLASVTDPINRTTSYLYNTGINSWLISRVTYPTGASSNYTYGSAPVGSDLTTYYVTLQNINSSASTLTRSTSFNYSIVNCQITSCNATFSDGNSVQGYLLYGFSGPLMSTTEKNQSGGTILTHIDYYDGSGRVDSEQIISPSGALLVNSSSRYDDWGNVIYSSDSNNHESWFSYSNTNSSNRFVWVPGFSFPDFTSSFYCQNQTITFESTGLQSGYNWSVTLNGTTVYSITPYITFSMPLGVYNYTVGALANYKADLVNGTVTMNTFSFSIPITFAYNPWGHNNATLIFSETGLPAGTAWSVTLNGIVQNTTGSSITFVMTSGYCYSYTIGVPSGYIATLSSGMINVDNSSQAIPIVFGQGAISNQTTLNSINSHIHNLLLGQAQYQNGTGSAAMQTYFLYDSSGHLIQQKQYCNYAWTLTNYTYDKYGNMLTITDPLNRTTYFQYSSNYKYAYLTQQSIMVGSQNVSAIYTYNFTNGAMLTSTDPMGNTTTYTYDCLGRTLSVTYPSVGGVAANKTYFYNDTGNYITITDENGNKVKQVFDGLERLIQIIRYNGSSVYSTENYTYNWLNKVATHTLPSGSVYNYSYDSLGRLTAIGNPDGTMVKSSYNYTSNILLTTNENGYNTSYGYDWLNQLLWVRQYYNSTSYYQTNYTYDQVGDQLSTTDANGHTTTYRYDDLNRVVMTTYPDGTNQTMSYDSVGNLISRTDQIESTINYTYDTLNRLTQIRYADGSTVNYTYDKDGNRLSDIEQNFSSFYLYDALNRLTNETDIINGTAYTSLYTYDKAGNIVNITYPDNRVLSYSYDPLERVSSVGGYANFTYTVDGKISTIKYANNVTTTYSYDSRDRPTRILATYNGTNLMDLNYTFDGVGNILSIGNESYSYDRLDRLVSGSGSWGLYNYSYDPTGNMLSIVQNGVNTSSTYNINNQLTKMGSVNFTYDSNGNMLTKVNGSQTWSYGYDFENRLVNVSLNSQILQTNLYSSNGQRLIVTDNGSSVVYVYEGGTVIYEKNMTSGQTTDHFYANMLQVADLSNSIAHYYHEDLLSSVRLVTNDSIKITFSTNYLPFGVHVNVTGIEEFQYADKSVDAITGLYYFGARFYNPSMFRFITQDSFVGTANDSISLNRYIYAWDNPETNMDPTGHMMCAYIDGGSALPNIGTQMESSLSSGNSAINNARSSTTSIIANTRSSTTSVTNMPHITTSTEIAGTTQSTVSKAPIKYDIYNWPSNWPFLYPVSEDFPVGLSVGSLSYFFRLFLSGGSTLFYLPQQILCKCDWPGGLSSPYDAVYAQITYESTGVYAICYPIAWEQGVAVWGWIIDFTPIPGIVTIQFVFYNSNIFGGVVTPHLSFS